MKTMPFGMFWKPKNPSCIQVFVVPVYIGVGMVQYIVLYFPIIDISGKDINAPTHKVVDPFFGRIGPMIAVVHHIHPNAGHPDTDNYREKQKPPTWNVQCEQ